MIHIVKPNETLYQISKDYRVPLSSIINSNPNINPNVIFIGQIINIPGIPDPSTIKYHLVISISDRVLTLFKNNELFKSYKIAVGRILKETPTGEFVIINKAPNPGGPFGTMWMSLSKEHYGIHGTNNPSSIGKSVSKGCIRMYNKDVEELASIIPIGTRVKINP